MATTFKAPSDLRGFLEILKDRDELHEITCEVDPHLELAEIHRRVISHQGPALLFRNVKGSSFPVVTNLFGTKERVMAAFGNEPEKLIRKIAEAPHTLMPPSFKSLWNHKDLITRIVKTGLKRKRSTPITHRKQLQTNAESIPFLTTWPLDGGPFITLPLVYTEHPQTKVHNLGMYRIQRFDKETLGLHCQIGKGGGFHLKAAQELGQSLDVNVFVGGPPALILSAIAPLPENVPELLFASFVLGEKLPLTSVSESTLPLIGSCEFAFVGEVNPNEQRPEGPFGDHYGYYSLQHDYPVIHLKAIYHRDDAIFPATVVGKPQQEDYFIGDYLQELLAPIFPLVMPGVEELWSYGDTGFHSLAAARVKERYKREALGSALRILGEGQLSLTKFLIVVDKSVSLKRFSKLLEHALERCDMRTDLYLLGNTSMDSLDYSGPKVNEGSKGILLGCGEKIRDLPQEFFGQGILGFDIQVFCGGCLVVSGKSYVDDPDLPKQLAAHKEFENWQLIILSDDAEACSSSDSSFLWHVFTRFNPTHDISARETIVHNNHLGFIGPLVIDARMKPWYPGTVECDNETARLVERRWKEYGTDI